jgi:hypothetical protein
MKGIFSAAFIVTVVFAGAIGWGLNLVKIFGTDHLDGQLVLRIIGVFMAPIGAILGYF